MTAQFRKCDELQTNVPTKVDTSTEVNELLEEVKSDIRDLDVIELQQNAVNKCGKIFH